MSALFFEQVNLENVTCSESDKDTQTKGWTRGKLNKRSIIDEREARRRKEDSDNRKTCWALQKETRIERLKADSYSESSWEW